MLVKRTGTLLALALTATSAFLGACATDEYDKLPQRSAAPAPAAAPSNDGRVWANMLLPTGVKEGSVLSIRRSSPREVALGQTYDSEITVTNTSSDLNLENVVLTDTTSSNYKYASSVPAGTTTAGKTAWNLGTLKPGETKTIKVTGSAAEVGSIKSCYEVTYDPIACLAVNVVQPKLSLTATAPAEVLQCDPIAVRYTVTNNGTGPAKNVVVSAPLAKGVTTDTGATSVNANVGDLAPGQSKTVDVILKASEAGKVDTAPGAAADGGLKAAATTATTVRKPVLKIEKTGPAKSFLGRTVSYEITLTNTGDGEARDTVLEDVLPAGAKVVSATAGSIAGPGTLSWKLGTVKPGAVVKANVVIDSPGIGIIENKAIARAYCAAPVNASVKSDVAGIPAILLEVIDLTDPIEVGRNVTYEIIATNQGTATGTNIKIVATLEDSQKFVSAGGATAATADGKTVTFAALPSLAPKAQAKWTVSVTALKEGDVRFTTVMTSDQLQREVKETEATNQYK